MNPDFKDYLLDITNASACEELEIIQSLWSGYGKISRYKLIGSSLNTVVVKNIALNQSSRHPRGWNTGNSHNRKVKSYQVETHWYETWSQFCTSSCRIPKFLGSFSKGQDQWIILEDLNTNFPLRKHQVDFSEIRVCLKWLANFHVNFLSQKPTGLWKIGTYWNLETRPDELEEMKHQELKVKAHLVDELLNTCKFQTIVHGDAKLANFCFSENGKQVAAVDFQYVGGGCGMKDVAYFFSYCLSGSELEIYGDELLDFYFSELQKAFKISTSTLDFKELEQEWRNLYPVACTDFTRFLLGWMPTHQKINDYNLKMVNSVLASL